MSAVLDAAAVRARIDLIEDPEVPVTLTDLGVVREVFVDEDDRTVSVVLRPTRLACPARDEMARRVRAAVADVDPGATTSVTWEMSAWDYTDVKPEGSHALLQIGYADPALATAVCPYCRSRQVRREGAFGGSVCKAPYSCRSCGSTFDVLKNTPAERADR